ncbi:2526_t:CDS:2 [Paraglomus brasilianum]|uniref:2526_t:CDS:1 n=1 Tax=Paraglomus brasilianum TaxID=144538 RepID=A0A9N9GTG0_9GLOM|nr:2526_t:CDS:2 [Paraglomus brasilianum]
MSLFRGLSRVNVARATRSFNTSNAPQDEGIIRGLNKVLLIGKIASDPVQATSKNGLQRAHYDLVTYSQRKYPSFHNIVCLQPLQVQVVMEKFKRGLLVYVEGKLYTRQVVDERSERRVVSQILQDNFQILVPEQASEERPATNTEIPATGSSTTTESATTTEDNTTR